jgi:hypothetical protein
VPRALARDRGGVGRMTTQDREEFRAFLRDCTDSQVARVYQIERQAGRRGYAGLALSEAMRRGIDLTTD